MPQVCLNGKLIFTDQAILMHDNRAFRYGDGIFETSRVAGNKIPLFDLHMDRFFTGLKFMGLNSTVLSDQLHTAILDTCRKNNCEQNARVRLTAFNGNGGLTDSNNEMQWLIEANPIDPIQPTLDTPGLETGIYKEAFKPTDALANLKSSSFQLYALAARYAKANGWQEAFVLNHHGRIADASIANVFIIKDERIITPALTEGPVGGVMRKYLLQQLKLQNYTVSEESISVEALATADEIFLTNAVRGIQWVSQFNGRSYSNTITKEIYQKLVSTIWA